MQKGVLPCDLAVAWRVVVYRVAHNTVMTDGDILRADGIESLRREQCKY